MSSSDFGKLGRNQSSALFFKQVKQADLAFEEVEKPTQEEMESDSKDSFVMVSVFGHEANAVMEACKHQKMACGKRQQQLNNFQNTNKIRR